MKKIFTFALLAVFALCAQAEEKDSTKSNKPVFTTIKENPITSIKDQNRSGTCWDYSTLSFFEAEILKATGKTYDLCESFVANKTYMERAIQVVRYPRLTASALKAQCLSQAHSMETRSTTSTSSSHFLSHMLQLSQKALQRKSLTNGRWDFREYLTPT